MESFFVDARILSKFNDLVKEEEIMDLPNILKTHQVMKMLGGLLIALSKKKYSKSVTIQDYEKLVVFSLLWGVAGSYETPERIKFESLIREKQGLTLPTPKEGETLFDYYIHISDRGIDWKVIHPEKWKVPKQIYFSRLLMPTTDSSRVEILVNFLKLNN